MSPSPPSAATPTTEDKTMNGEVDVLHVMREASAVLIRDGHKAIPEDLLDAHDAVAELIEAVKENRVVTQNFANDGRIENFIDWQASERRVVAALSRLTGAA